MTKDGRISLAGACVWGGGLKMPPEPAAAAEKETSSKKTLTLQGFGKQCSKVGDVL